MNITHGLRRALQVNPQGIAILEEERRLSWAEVGERVSRLAGALGQLGIAKGDRIAVLMLNSSRYLELYLAVGWAGAVIVPLNIRWSVAENRDALQDSGARLLVIDNAIPGLTLLHADNGEPPGGVAGYESLLAVGTAIPDAMAGRDDLAGIFYTGGTTGRSKGVMLSHGNLMANALQSLAEGLSSRDAIYLHAAPMFHLANGSAFRIWPEAGIREASIDVCLRGISGHSIWSASFRLMTARPFDDLGAKQKTTGQNVGTPGLPSSRSGGRPSPSIASAIKTADKPKLQNRT
jgi:long-chain acyl-CoA synthetase